jgi:signal transduction histidine kinase/CheY-like chemotaxis protein
MKFSDTIAFLRSRVLEQSSWERDGGYRDVLTKMCHRGLLAGGILAIVGVALYLTTHLIILGKIPILWRRPWTEVDPQLLVMWDKLLVFVAGAVMIAVYKAEAGLTLGRFVPAAIVVVLTSMSVFDEVTGALDITSGAVYPTLYLLVAAGAIPYRPLQMLVLAAAVYGVVIASEAVFPALLDVETKGTIVRQLPYMCIGTVVLTGLTVLLSGTRRDQYLARTEAQRLTSELEAHARRLEEARIRTEEQSARLVEAERLKDRFFGNISHEFRTPLTLIVGPVEDALEGSHGELQPAIRGMLSAVRASAGRLLTLVNDLLELTRIDADRVRLHVEEHDLVPFLSTVVHHFVDVASRRQIQLRLQSTVDHLPLSFDPNAIEKVVYNLLSNAFKFVPDGGAIRVSLDTEVREKERWAKVTVKDNGPGIGPDELPLIWDRFHRIQKKGISEGTGIGLSLVRELVQLHSGGVSVHSEPGFGSEFTFRLPVEPHLELPERLSRLFEVSVTSDVRSEENPGLEECHTDGPGDAPVVLIVDNDAGIRKYVRGQLEALYRVHEAEDGLQALEFIRAERPALIISDVMMPHMDGFELCRTVKADSDLSDIPVVLLTALADEQAQVEGLQCGADDYIPKPFSSSALVARVENLIELRRILQNRLNDRVVEPSPVDVPSMDESFIRRVKAVVEEHIGDTQFGVEWLADEVGLSARQLQRRIREITRLSAAGYVRAMRLKRAAQLLSRNAGNVSQVAYAVGFRDPAYFSRLFKQTFEILPSEYAVNSVAEDSVAAHEVEPDLEQEHNSDGRDE